MLLEIQVLSWDRNKNVVVLNQFPLDNSFLSSTKLKNIIQQSVVLDSQGIKEHTCEILEGGTEAFKKRENKYGI
jgi:hypothetical protein